MKVGWEVKTLGDIADVKGGKRVPRGYKLQSEPTKHPYITVSDFTDDGTIDTSNIRYVSSEVFDQIKRYTISSNNLYLSIAGTIGKTGYVPSELDGASLTENACKLVLRPGIDRDFIYYFTKSDDFARQAGTNTRIAAQPKLALERLKTIKLPIPSSLPEQQRIVGLLDEAFEGIATATANAEKNLKNARALFESHLQSVFTQRGLGWEEKLLGDVCEFENGDRGKNYPHRSEYVESGIPWINTGHIQRDGTLSETEMNFISREKYESLRSGKIQPGDLVYCLRGATLGKTALVDPLTEGAVASSLVILRPSSVLDSRYLYSFLTSPLGQGLIKGYENGAAQPNLGAKSVAKYPISFPPIAEQKQLVAKLDDLHEETQRLESIYQQKLAALNALKKSLLHQAFNGELTGGN
ncbi:MAG: restriction endonuclease subunit S [Nitrospira sp. CG24D]|nr:MAG: restriction endonuclease subunit S [Nitrospira sp. CG24D]